MGAAVRATDAKPHPQGSQAPRPHRAPPEGQAPTPHAGAHGHGRRPGAGVPTRQRDSISVMKSPRLNGDLTLHQCAQSVSRPPHALTQGRSATLARLPADRAAEPQPASPASTSRPT